MILANDAANVIIAIVMFSDILNIIVPAEIPAIHTMIKESISFPVFLITKIKR